MACPAITNAVASGFLEPAVMLDGQGNELHGYIPTEKARSWFGPRPVILSFPADVVRFPTAQGCGND